MRQAMRPHPSGSGWHSTISHSVAISCRPSLVVTTAMPMRRLPSMQRRTMSRYRGSKMFSAIFSPAGPIRSSAFVHDPQQWQEMCMPGRMAVS